MNNYHCFLRYKISCLISIRFSLRLSLSLLHTWRNHTFIKEDTCQILIPFFCQVVPITGESEDPRKVLPSCYH